MIMLRLNLIFSYKLLINGRTDLRVRTVIGNPKEVYDYHYERASASKEYV